jgi:hypothetical protein
VAWSSVDGAYPGNVGTGDPHRGTQAMGVAALTLPCVLLAHLLLTGAVVALPVCVLCALAVLAVTWAVPVRSTGRLALLAGGAQLAGHAVLTLAPSNAARPPGCLRAVGRGAELGLRLAVFRHDAACPAGTLAPGTTMSAALGAVLTAVVIVAGHAAVAAMSGAVVAGTRVLGALSRALTRLVVLLVAPLPPACTWQRVLPARPGARRPIRPLRRPVVPALRRGPPAVRTALG